MTAMATIASQFPTMIPMPVNASNAPVYDGWRRNRYGPVVTRRWPGSTRTTRLKALRSVAMAQARKAIPVAAMVTPIRAGIHALPGTSSPGANLGADRATANPANVRSSIEPLVWVEDVSSRMYLYNVQG